MLSEADVCTFIIKSDILTNDECTQVCYCSHYLNVVSHITMSDLMMNVHAYVTNNTTYTLLYVNHHLNRHTDLTYKIV
jgi:hypothetical protein